MKVRASELSANQWFTRPGPDERVHQRLKGDPETIDGEVGVPVKPLFPLISKGFFIPADEEVELYRSKCVRIS